MSNSETLVYLKSKRDNISRLVETGPGHHSMVRATHGLHLSKAHSGEEHFWGPAKSPE